MQTTKTAPAGDTPYRVPRESSRWPSLALAASMHALLFFFLWAGVHWQSTPPVAVEAEVWDMKTQAAAPKPPPEPEAEATPPTPTPPPVERVAPPERVEPPVAKVPDADIALERRKQKLKLAKEKLAEEERREELRKQEEQEKADKAAKLAKLQDKAEARAKALAEAKAEAKAEKDKEAKAAKDAAEKKDLADKKLADKLAKAKHAAEENKAIDKLRAEDMRRMTGAIGSGGSGTAAKSTGPRSDSGYQAAVTAKIKSNLHYPGGSDVEGDPRAVFKIEQLPTGEILSVRKVKSSGIPAYDSAVENAIHQSSPLPKKKDGTVDREVTAEFKLKDTP